MKTEKNILIAFLLNAFFSVFELVGGIFTGSVAIISDAVHDLGDTLSIGLAYVLEKKSKKQPDNEYTYGYTRYSVLGALITSTILIVGSVIVVFNAVNRIINPVIINYDGMIIFAIIGAVVNFLAAYFTREGDSLNQKAVNLHMLEDVLGWIVVLVGAITMKFTNFSIIDPILSIIVALFILVNALNSYKSIFDLFLEKTPSGFDIEKIRRLLMEIEDVDDVHHIHIWSMDGVNNYATMHIVSSAIDMVFVKKCVKNKLKELGIGHVTIEIEDADEECLEKECSINVTAIKPHCHHAHHHGQHVLSGQHDSCGNQSPCSCQDSGGHPVSYEKSWSRQGNLKNNSSLASLKPIVYSRQNNGKLHSKGGSNSCYTLINKGMIGTNNRVKNKNQ